MYCAAKDSSCLKSFLFTNRKDKLAAVIWQLYVKRAFGTLFSFMNDAYFGQIWNYCLMPVYPSSISLLSIMGTVEVNTSSKKLLQTDSILNVLFQGQKHNNTLNADWKSQQRRGKPRRSKVVLIYTFYKSVSLQTKC